MKVCETCADEARALLETEEGAAELPERERIAAELDALDDELRPYLERRQALEDRLEEITRQEELEGLEAETAKLEAELGEAEKKLEGTDELDEIQRQLDELNLDPTLTIG
jgi:chromosome segregation ATPase